LSEDNKVHTRQRSRLVAERLSDNSLQPIALYRKFSAFFGYDEAQPRNVAIIRAAQYGEVFVSAWFGLVKDTGVSSLIQEPVFPWKSVLCRRCFRFCGCSRNNGGCR
jgi:hypothetical protein